MARLTSEITFTGSLGELTAYKMKGTDGIVLRTKGGPSKEKVKTDPSYANTRRTGGEFGGRSTTSKYILRGLQLLKTLSDYRIAGTINAWLQPIQELDTESEWGQRNICLSKQPHLLAGFNLNLQRPFDTIVQAPLAYNLSRDTLSARIDIPALLPGMNLLVPGSHPFYRLMAHLAIVPDVFFAGGKYKPERAYEDLWPVVAQTEWYLVESGSPATQLELPLSDIPVDTGFSLMLSIGICMGKAGVAGSVKPLKRSGAAKIMALV